MDYRQRIDLDRHITGNYGEESVPDDDETTNLGDAMRLISELEQDICEVRIDRDEARAECERLRGVIQSLEQKYQREIELGDRERAAAKGE